MNSYEICCCIKDAILSSLISYQLQGQASSGEEKSLIDMPIDGSQVCRQLKLLTRGRASLI